MAELPDPWADPDAEYETLVDVILPVAQAQFSQVMTNWDAEDTKALGLLAIGAAAIAGLAAAHGSINEFWWIAALGYFAGCVLMGMSLWPRTAYPGPDLLWFHDYIRGDTVAAAREMVEGIIQARELNEVSLDSKARCYFYGLGVMALSTIIALAVVLIRP